MNHLEEDDSATISFKKTSFDNMNDVNAFLAELDIDKDNSTRFICWLMSFNRLSINSKKWNKELHSLAHKYQILINKYFPDSSFTQPLKAIPVQSASVIESDIKRGIRWFQSLSSDLSLPEYYISDIFLRAIRILAVMTLDSSENSHSPYSYTQGHDRYVFVSLLLSFKFAAENKLSPDFAESTGFFLARDFITMTAISKYLENVTETEDHFLEMDKEMEIISPDIMHQLALCGQSSIHFALRWEFLLFADEYDIKQMFLLWDQILVQKEIFKRFLFALCIAHLRQIPQPRPGEVVIEKIQSFRDWNVEQVITDALKYVYLQREVQTKFKTSHIIVFIIMFLFLLFFWYRLNQIK